jgi:hypothetical protein
LSKIPCEDVSREKVKSPKGSVAKPKENEDFYLRFISEVALGDRLIVA